jgi:hypothetical protein
LTKQPHVQEYEERTGMLELAMAHKHRDELEQWYTY